MYVYVAYMMIGLYLSPFAFFRQALVIPLVNIIETLSCWNRTGNEEKNWREKTVN